MKVVSQIFYDLIGQKDAAPQEYMFECVCTLLQAVGHTLEAKPHGKELVSNVIARLVNLKQSVAPDGEPFCSNRIRFAIQDLVDLRSRGWVKKSFKERATPLADVKQDAANQSNRQVFKREIVGLKPSCVNELSSDPSSGNPASIEQQIRRSSAWNKDDVEQVVEEFIADGNKKAYTQAWKSAQLSQSAALKSVQMLLELGITNTKTGTAMVEAVELLIGDVVDARIVADALSPLIIDLEDLLLDVPHASSFLHVLLAKVLLDASANSIKVVQWVLEAQPFMPSTFHWNFLSSVLGQVRDKGGSKAVEKVLEQKILCNRMLAIRGGSQKTFRQALQAEGLL
mmetsp:Transcript_134379/g.233564  ORF Transcript_134379/g.233564 Transcript_134379/m.233564 type:complete len:341 (-) Transcript_134379:425-1447(-)